MHVLKTRQDMSMFHLMPSFPRHVTNELHCFLKLLAWKNVFKVVLQTVTNNLSEASDPDAEYTNYFRKNNKDFADSDVPPVSTTRPLLLKHVSQY